MMDDVREVVQSTSLEAVTPDVEECSKLAELRTQFLEASRRQKPHTSRPHHDQVIGYVEIPLYRSEGRSLRDAGRSFQVFLYEQ